MRRRGTVVLYVSGWERRRRGSRVRKGVPRRRSFFRSVVYKDETGQVAGVDFGDMHLNSSRIFRWKAAFHAKCSRVSFVRVGSPSGGELHFHCSKVAHPVLILTLHYTEQRVEDNNQPSDVYSQES